MGLAERLGYRYPDPNALQRLVQAVAGSRLGGQLAPRTLAPLDRVVSRVSGNRIDLAVVLAGLPVISLTTTGRRSGLRRDTHLIAVPFAEGLALVATNFGQAATPAWALNLRADPDATVTYQGITVSVRARTATPEERAAILAKAAALFAGTVTYEERLRDKRQVDIFVLTESS